ncbi:MAG: hypothetical protein Q8R88_14750 [Desulfoprunum sp.]|nr:hypothetical protein [Desulfoprunum sp.]
MENVIAFGKFPSKTDLQEFDTDSDIEFAPDEFNNSEHLSNIMPAVDTELIVMVSQKVPNQAFP